MRTLILGFFLLSGAAGLVYEVAWIRQAGSVIGNTTYAVGTVVGVFMGGLALGAWLGGRWADRRQGPSLLRLYGALELGVAASALAVAPLLALSEPLFRVLWNALGEGSPVYVALRVVLVGLLLILPTTLMGATLPVLTRWCSETADAGPREAGRAYAVNTFGGVLGTLAAGFWIVPGLGLRAGTWIAAAVNLLIGLVCIARAKGAAPLRNSLPAPDLPPLPRLALAVAAGSGFAALACQVAWTRSLTLALGSTVHAFTAILSSFILGLALGSAAAAWALPRLKRTDLPLAAVQAALGVAVFALLPFLGDLPLQVAGSLAADPDRLARLQLAVAAAVVLLPAFLMGAVFPLLLRHAGVPEGAVGRSVAAVYTANTLGCIAGSLAASFLLVPLLGLTRTLALAATISLALAAALLPRKWAAAPLAAAVLAWAFLPRWDPRVLASGAFLYGAADLRSATSSSVDLRTYLHRDTELLAEHWDAYGLVTVHRGAGGLLTMRVNGKADASIGPADRPNMHFTGHLPLLHHPAPKRALLVGLGGGLTLDAMRKHPLERIDCVELSPAVVKASSAFPEAVDGLKDPRVRLVVGDGRSLVAYGREPYDAIVSQPSNLWVSGMATLFTRDFFELSARRLSPGGVFGQWVHAYRLSPDDFKLVVRTFFAVFPHGWLWEVFPGSDYVLVGAREPLPLATVGPRRDATGALGEWLAHEAAPLAALYGHLVTDAPGALAWAGPGAVLTDDRCSIEYTAPRALHRDYRAELLQSLDPVRAALEIPGVSDARERRRAVARAVRLFAETRPLKALAELPAALDPRTVVFADQAADAAIEIGLRRKEAGDPQAAVACFNAVPRLSGKYAEAQSELGDLLASAFRDFDRAAAAFQRAREADPRSFAAAVGLAQLHDVRGERSASVARWQDAVGLRPDSVETHWRFAQALLRDDRKPAAEAAVRRVLELKPDHPEAKELLQVLAAPR
jgi:spermidine synthase